MKKFILLLQLVLMLCATTAVSATESERQISDGKVTISGQMENLSGYTTLAISCENIDELWDHNNDSIVYFDSMECSENYQFDAILSDSGQYKVYIGLPNGKLVERELIFIRKSENVSAVTSLNTSAFDSGKTDAEKITAIAAILDSNKKTFGLYDSVYSGVNMTKVGKILLSYLNTPLDTEETDENSDIVNKCVLIEALNENKINNINTYADILGIKGYDYYDLYLVEQAVNITARLSGKQFDSYAQFESALKEAVLLNKIEFADGYGEVKEVLERYAGLMGVDSKYLTDTAYKAIEKKKFNSFSDMVSAIKATEVSGSTLTGVSGASSAGSSQTGSSLSSAPSVKYSIPDNSTPTVTEKTARTFFNDLGNVSWAEEAINYLYLHGVIYGKEEGVFSPKDTVKREEFIQMIIRAFNLKNVVADNPYFNDVEQDAWYYDAISIAKSSGIVNGLSDDTFGIGVNIKRQDIAVMVMNALTVCNMELSADNMPELTDFATVSEYASDAVTKLAGAKIINGDDNKQFNPQNYATRAEASIIIYNVMQMIK